MMMIALIGAIKLEIINDPNAHHTYQLSNKHTLAREVDMSKYMVSDQEILTLFFALVDGETAVILKKTT